MGGVSTTAPKPTAEEGPAGCAPWPGSGPAGELHLLDPKRRPWSQGLGRPGGPEDRHTLARRC